MTRSLLLGVLVLAGATTPALAQAPFYLGLKVGAGLDGRIPDGPGSLDTDTPFGGYAGWRFNDLFALEFGAMQLGNSQRSGILDAGLDVDGWLYQLGVSATMPVSDSFDIQGGVGGFRLNEDGKAITLIGPVDFDNSGSGAYAEIGGRQRLNDQWSLRFGYTWYDFDAAGDGHFWAGAQIDL